VTEGRIVRQRRYAQVPDALAVDKRLTDTAVRVWVRLSRYAGKDGAAYPSRERLADDLGCSRAKIGRALSNLMATGWITRKQRTATVWDTVLHDDPVAHGRASRRLTYESADGSRTSRQAAHIRAAEGDPTEGDPTEGGSPLTSVAPSSSRMVTSPPSPPRPRRAPGARARKTKGGKITKDQGPTGTDGHPVHIYDGNARRWAERIVRERRLPLDAAELVAWCYRAGRGDPWEGHRLVDRATEKELDTARDPVAVLRGRLKAGAA